MKKNILFLIFCVFLGMSFYAHGYSLEENLPQNTLIYSHIYDMTKTRKAFERTALCQLLKEPEIREFVKSIINPLLAPHKQKIQQGLGMLKQQAGLPIQKLLKLVSGNIELAIVDFNPQDMAMPIHAAFCLQFKQERATLEQLLKSLSEKAGLPPLQKLPVKSSVPIYAVPYTPVSLAFIEDCIVISTNQNLLVEVTNPASQTQKLVKNPSFVNAKAKNKTSKAKYNPAMFTYINIEKIVQKALPMIPHFRRLPAPIKKMIGDVGLYDIKALSFAINLRGKYIQDALFLELSPERRGLIKFFSNQPVSQKTLALMPKYTCAIYAMHLDFSELLKDIEGLIQIIDPKGRHFEQYKKAMAMADEKLGFSIKKDVFASLGVDHYTFMYMPQEGGLIPRRIKIVSVKDFDALQRWTLKLNERFRLDIKKLHYHGKELFYVSSPLGKFGSNPLKKFRFHRHPRRWAPSIIRYLMSGIAFFAEGDKLFLGTMQDVKDYVDFRANQKESFLDSKHHQALSEFASKDSCWIFYHDCSSLFQRWWNSLVPIVKMFEGSIRGFGVPFDSAKLPRARVIARHLIPAIFTLKSDKSGILIEAHSSIGGVSHLGLGTIGAAGLGWFSYKKQSSLRSRPSKPWKTKRSYKKRSWKK